MAGTGQVRAGGGAAGPGAGGKVTVEPGQARAGRGLPARLYHFMAALVRPQAISRIRHALRANGL